MQTSERKKSTQLRNPLVRTRLMSLDYSICTETFGNGVKTIPAHTMVLIQLILKVQDSAENVSCVAVHGRRMCGHAEQRIGVGGFSTIEKFATRASV
jgi:hypothetical protein